MDDVTGKRLVTLAVVQMDCTLGDVAANLGSIAHYSRAAADCGADLVVFSECATTGYFVAERLTEIAEPPDGRNVRFWQIVLQLPKAEVRRGDRVEIQQVRVTFPPRHRSKAAKRKFLSARALLGGGAHRAAPAG